MLAKQRPSWTIGVSTWGQGDESKLLWVRDHWKNVAKIKRHGEDRAVKSETGNVTTYYQPALSWTKKFRKGNLDEIIRCNELNFQAHVLDSGKPDLIWVQASYPGAFIGKFLSEKYQVPFSVHLRLGGFMFQYLLDQVGSMKTALLDSLKAASQLTTTSNFQRNELPGTLERAEVVYNPVDIDFFRPPNNNENGIEILSVGRLEEEKGFDLLIEAISRVPSAILNLGGSGSLSKKLRRQAAMLRIEDRVNFMGEMSRLEVKEAMQKCSFYVLPSRYETFGNVLLEAMACGKPVVTTKCGGPQEMVPGASGYFADINPNDLAKQIERMTENRSSFKTDATRNQVETTYAPSVWADQVEKLFKAITAK